MVHSARTMRRDELLDLNDVLQHPGRRIEVDISTEMDEEEDLDLVTPLDGFLEAVSTGNLLLISGEFSTTAVLECARCTEPLELPISFQLDEQFPVVGVPSSLNHQDVAKVSPDEPFELFEGNSLIVENLLRQNLLLEIPIQPLCTYGWDGDCPIAIARGLQKTKNEAARAEFQKLAGLLKDEPSEKSKAGEETE